MDRREINAVLASAGLRPQHKFGQNFMVDQNILRAIADAGQIAPEDVVLEVGPGVGNLTRLLAARAAAVLAVDIDTRLMAAARQHHAAQSNITWLRADALAGKHEINPLVVDQLRTLTAAHPAGTLKLVSNLPYNAASPLIAELLVLMWQESRTPPSPPSPHAPLAFSRLAFTVQWEVAERMAASPGTADYGPLGILIQLMAEVQILRKIPPGAFWPPPKIHSALVSVVPVADKIARIARAPALQKLLTGLFGHRRQTLRNGLKHFLGDAFTPALADRLAAAGLDLALRPEALIPENFLTLAEIAGI